MKRFSAQYIITNSGPALKRGIVTIGDEGRIIDIEDTGGELRETPSVEFHNGVIIPGFVNCHCHLELSHMRGTLKGGKGLDDFLEDIRTSRSAAIEDIKEAARIADKEMYAAGINLCADICNTSHTFRIKKNSLIRYINLLEVFGIDPEKAEKRLDEIVSLEAIASELDLPYYLVPHSVYSLSLKLFRLLKEKTAVNKITSIHFMESPVEAELVRSHSGPLMESYISSGLITSGLETVNSHADAILNEVTKSGSLILVHNTFADKETIRRVKERNNLYWCLCPGSNMYIENEVPPVSLLIDEGCSIIIGTDSLASNRKLNVLEELKILQKHNSWLSLEELIAWATVNGARALGMEDSFGIIAKGMNPGLLLIKDADLINMKLTPESYISRLA